MGHLSHRPRLLLLLLAAAVVFSGSFLAYRYFYTSPSQEQIGDGVTVSGSNLPSNLQATTSVVRVPFSPKLASSVSPTYQITPSGKLGSTVSITLPLTQAVPPGSKLVVMTSESTKGPWTPLIGYLLKDGKSVSISVNHLSFFDVIWLDLSGILNSFKTNFLDALLPASLASASPPRCQNTSQARQGNYSISSTNSSTVYWCFGIENGKRILKVVNDRQYSLTVEHPGLALLTPGEVPLGLQNIEALDARLRQEVLLLPGAEAAFGADIPVGSIGKIHTKWDAGSQILDALQIGVDVVVTIAGLLGYVVVGAIDYLDKVLSSAKCANALTDSITNFPPNPGKAFFSCFDQEALKLAFGDFWGNALSIILTSSGIFDFLVGGGYGLVASVLFKDQYTVTIAHTIASACPTGSGACLGIRSGDIDGDGRPDQVGVTFLKGSDQFIVHVILATGRVLAYVVKPPTLPKDTYTSASFLGLTDIDGSGRDEVVVRPIGCEFSCGYTVLELLQGALQPMPFYGSGGSVSSDVVGAFVCSINNGTHQVTVYNEYVTPGSIDVYQADGRGGMRFVSRSIGLHPPVPSGAYCPGLSVS